METELRHSKGTVKGREFVLQISRFLALSEFDFDNRLDLLNEIADYCEGKIQEVWDEELSDEE